MGIRLQPDPIGHLGRGGLSVVGGGAVVPSSLLTGLVAYWKLGEASGTRVDSLGANDLTTSISEPTQSAGIIGNAAQFTASNAQYLTHADSAALRFNNSDWTICAWIYLDTIGTDRVFISKDGFGGGKREFNLRYLNTPKRFQADVYNGASTVVATMTDAVVGEPSLSTWYFLAVWLDTAQNKLFLQINNGTVQSSAALSAPNAANTADFNVGALVAGTVYHNGRIDEVGKWSRMLTAPELTALYNGGAGKTYPF